MFAVQVQDIERMQWGMNTDVNAVFTLLLKASVYPIALVDRNQDSNCLLPVMDASTCDVRSS